MPVSPDAIIRVVVGAATPPVAVADAFVGDEDTTIIGNVLANDTDDNGDPITAALAVGPTNGALTLNADGSFIYTPAANFNGSDSFTYRPNDGVEDGNITTVTLTVNALNDEPTATDGNFTTDEDAAFSCNLLSLLAAADIDGDDLDILSVGTTDLGSFAVDTETGAFTFTPDANENGTGSVEVTLSDGTASIVRTLSFTVVPVNDAPLAVDDTAATSFDTPILLPLASLFANDTDADGPETVLTFAGNAVGGSVVVDATSILFTPTVGFSGEARFDYTISDGAATDTATVRITVAGPGNVAPVAIGDNFDGAEDTAITGNVLANDTDADGDDLTALVVTVPTNGTLSLNPNGSFIYTPAADFNGTDSFTYRVNDGTADSGVATVTLTVAPVNDAPVVQGDVFLTDEDVPLSGNLAINDIDVDGDTLTYSVVGAVPLGLVLATDGTFTYTPPANFNGTVAFDYLVEDGQGASAQASVVIEVAPVNDAPQNLQLSNASIAENSALGTVVGLLSASDIDGDALTFALVGISPFTVVGNELRVNGVIDFEATASLPITLRAADPSGASVERSLTISVLDVVETNPAPGLVFSTGSQGLGDAPAGPSQGVGGLVQAGPSPDYGTLIEAVGVWNSVKNAFTSVDAWSPGLGTILTVANFVDTRLDLDNAGAVGLDVTLVGAKRGEVFTAGGDDRVSIVFHSNEGTWNNTLRVGSGAGDDVITATTVARSALDEALLADNATPANGPLWNRNYDGRFSVLDVDLGEGNDTVTATDVRLVANGGAGNDVLMGGRRNDQLTGGDGDDFLTGGLGADRFRFDNDDGSDVIMDFSVAQGDKVQLSSGGSYTLAGTSFTYGATNVTAANGHVWTAADFLFV